MKAVIIKVSKDTGKVISRELTGIEALSALNFMRRIEMGHLETPDEASAMRKIFVVVQEALAS